MPGADDLLIAARSTLLDALDEVVPFAVELRGGDPVINERLRA